MFEIYTWDENVPIIKLKAKKENISQINVTHPSITHLTRHATLPSIYGGTLPEIVSASALSDQGQRVQIWGSKLDLRPAKWSLNMRE